MPTIHYSKTRFIEEMTKFIGDDEYIILSTEIEGTLEVKRGIKKVPFVFAADAFERQDTIADLLKTKMISIIIAPESIVAEKFRNKKEEPKKARKKSSKS